LLRDGAAASGAVAGGKAVVTGGCVRVAGNPGVAAGPDGGARLIAGPDGVSPWGTLAGGMGGGASPMNWASAGWESPIARTHVNARIHANAR
jgi:hypothetical protein